MSSEAIDTTSDLSKVDSAISGLSSSPTAEKKMGHRRTSSSASGVFNVADLEDPAVLKKFLTTPPVKKIDLHFPLGLEVTARNLKGVTIKDALDAIHKQFKKKADDELELPVLAGFEWDKEESWTRLIVHQKKEGAPSGGKKKNKKNKDDDE
ncbi:hypothetical protein G7Y79_00037g073420 [Physcia stellaris]|nr:hypothetical protein G7Y79_00037g073420 [Physcia stellaris]